MTTLVPVGLRTLSVRAPDESPTYTRGTYGEMWNWIGDGRAMFSLIVAARAGGEGTDVGVHRRLVTEADRIGRGLVKAPGSDPLRCQELAVAGADAAFLADVDGLREGLPVHNAVLLASGDGRLVLLHVAVPDTSSGHQLASAVTSSLRLIG